MGIAISSASAPETVAALFDLSIGIERKAAAFYAGLAAVFRHVPEVSAFWQGLCDEEIEHERILSGVCERLTPQMRAAPPEPSVVERVLDAGSLIGAICVDEVCTLDDAYEMAHDLEFSEVNAVFKLLAMAGVPAETHRRFVVEHIERHQNRLLEFGSAHGGRPWRLRIMARRR